MTSDTSDNTDGYYDDDISTDEELDLSFLDEDENEGK